jgi:two-component system, NarL family, sensor histidine kinase DesK
VTGSAGTSRSESWFTRNGWLLAAMWLVFLVFPWLAIVTDDDLGPAGKVTATALMVAFALVYVDGFRRQFSHEQRDARPWSRIVEREYTGRVHVAILIAIGVILFAVVGPAGLGVMTFVVAFAIFHFAWSTAWTALIGGTALTVIVPLAAGSLDDLWFMALIVLVVGTAAMLIRSIEATQSRQADLRTQLAVSDERNRVARDVHDVLGHSLTAVILKAELCQKLLDGIEPDDDQDRARLTTCREQLNELRSVGRSALAEIRSTVGGLRAANLADEVTVARTVLADAGVELLVTGDVTDVPEQHRPVLAWVVREAVTNIVRHAEASRCHIELGPHRSVETIVLRISDDGVGVADPSSRGAVGGGNGLRGLRERIEVAGGDLRVRSDGGTTLEVTL